MTTSRTLPTPDATLVSLKGKKFKLGEHEYKMCDTIATGPFSSVYLVEADGIAYAMKVEMQNGCIRPVLKLDHAVLSQIGGQRGFPFLTNAGRTETFKYVVMQLVGPDLSMLLEFLPNNRFSCSTIYKIALQTLERLKTLHEAGWLNRDVKAQNFAVGLGEDSSNVYMLDFGLTRRFSERDGKRHLLRSWGPSVGTYPYAPLSSLGFSDQTPADDLEGWLYMIVHLLKGLPWHNSKNQMNLAKTREWKMYCRREGGRNILFEGLPQGWKAIFQVILKTSQKEMPDYDKISNMIVAISRIENIDLSQQFDWQVNPVLRSLVRLGPLSCNELTVCIKTQFNVDQRTTVLSPV